MPLIQGSVDKTAIIVGDWSEIAIEYPPGSDSWLYIGSAKEGALEVSKEIYDHYSNAFPRIVDLRIPIKTGMKFTAQLEEIHAENIKLIVGQDPTDSNSYVYLGALNIPIFFKFRARRERNSDAQVITVVFWKAMSSGLFQLGGGDEAIKSPVEFVALDDASGDYGGSSSAPLGYIHIPAKA